MILETEGLAVGGEAVARAPDGRVVFVEGAAPREMVRVEVLRTKKRFASARVIEVLVPSRARVEPRCPHFGTCGGCALQHVGAPTQTREKTSAAWAAIARLAKTRLPEPAEPAWSGPAFGYRTRARWQLRGGRLGYFARRSRRLVPTEVCPILHPALEEVLRRLSSSPPTEKPAELAAVVGSGRVGLWSDELPHPRPGWTPEGAVIVPPGRGLETRDGAGRAFVGPAHFAQANAAGNDALLDTLDRWLPEVQVALELFSGSGNFTRVVERHARRIVAAELDQDAVQLAARVAGPATELWSGDAAGALDRARREGLAPGLVVVNPPRPGLDARVVKSVSELAPDDVLYVSCDPATFARDVARFAGGGYRVVRIRFFDLYPQTPHLEVMARLSRSPGA